MNRAQSRKQPAQREFTEQEKKVAWQKAAAISELSECDAYCAQATIEGEPEDVGTAVNFQAYPWNWEKTDEVIRKRFDPTKADRVEYQVCLSEFFDLKEKLPEQLSEWMRRCSARLLKAANDLDGYPDDRDLEVIRKLMNGNLEAVFDENDELVLTAKTPKSRRKAVKV